MTAKYFAYRNLRTGGFSIKQRGRVVERPFIFVMSDVEFKVSEVGRQRVLDQQQRNVHAYVVGDNYESFEDDDIRTISLGINVNDPKLFMEVTYNPYHLDSFVLAKDNRPIKYTDFMVGFQDKIYIRTSEIK